MAKDPIVTESQLADVEAASRNCQSLDADAHGKVTRVCAAYRQAMKDLAHARKEVARLRKGTAKPKADAKPKK